MKFEAIHLDFVDSGTLEAINSCTPLTTARDACEAARKNYAGARGDDDSIEGNRRGFSPQRINPVAVMSSMDVGGPNLERCSVRSLREVGSRGFNRATSAADAASGELFDSLRNSWR